MWPALGTELCHPLLPWPCSPPSPGTIQKPPVAQRVARREAATIPAVWAGVAEGRLPGAEGWAQAAHTGPGPHRWWPPLAQRPGALQVQQALMQLLFCPALVLHQLERPQGTDVGPPQLAGSVPLPGTPFPTQDVPIFQPDTRDSHRQSGLCGP